MKTVINKNVALHLVQLTIMSLAFMKSEWVSLIVLYNSRHGIFQLHLLYVIFKDQQLKTVGPNLVLHWVLIFHAACSEPDQLYRKSNVNNHLV